MNVLCRVLAEEKPKSLQAATNELKTQEKKQLQKTRQGKSHNRNLVGGLQATAINLI